MRNKRAGIPFLAVGIAFLAIGAGGQRTFLFVGLAFLVLGAVLLRRGRRSGE